MNAEQNQNLDQNSMLTFLQDLRDSLRKDFPLSQTQKHRLHKLKASLAQDCSMEKSISSFSMSTPKPVQESTPTRDIKFDSQRGIYSLFFLLENKPQEVPVQTMFDYLGGRPTSSEDLAQTDLSPAVLAELRQQLIYTFHCAVEEKIYQLNPSKANLLQSVPFEYTRGIGYSPFTEIKRNFFDDIDTFETDLKKSMSTFEEDKFKKLNFDLKSSLSFNSISQSALNKKPAQPQVTAKPSKFGANQEEQDDDDAMDMGHVDGL